jgi:hypothetical protein
MRLKATRSKRNHLQKRRGRQRVQPSGRHPCPPSTISTGSEGLSRASAKFWLRDILGILAALPKYKNAKFLFSGSVSV